MAPDWRTMADTIPLRGPFASKAEMLSFYTNTMLIKLNTHAVVQARMAQALQTWKQGLDALPDNAPAPPGALNVSKPLQETFVPQAQRNLMIESANRYFDGLNMYALALAEEDPDKPTLSEGMLPRIKSLKQVMLAQNHAYDLGEQRYQLALEQYEAAASAHQQQTARSGTELQAYTSRIRQLSKTMTDLITFYNSNCHYDEPVSKANHEVFRYNYQFFVPNRHYFHRSHQTDHKGRSNSFYCYEFTRNQFDLHVHCDAWNDTARGARWSWYGRGHGEQSVDYGGATGLRDHFVQNFPRTQAGGNVNLAALDLNQLMR